ncbi:MAG: NUDIX domain-containing protein, partial [Bacteroidota bacterium]
YKDTHPLLWDVSVAGHIGSGETPKASAVREVQEEIGLGIAKVDLEKIGYFKSVHQHGANLIDCEYHHTFLCALKTPLESLKKQESEVEELKLISFAQFQEDVIERKNAKMYVPHNPFYYQSIWEELQKRI